MDGRARRHVVDGHALDIRAIHRVVTSHVCILTRASILAGSRVQIPVIRVRGGRVMQQDVRAPVLRVTSLRARTRAGKPVTILPAGIRASTHALRRARNRVYHNL
jgi:hypothetical protein